MKEIKEFYKTIFSCLFRDSSDTSLQFMGFNTRNLTAYYLLLIFFVAGIDLLFFRIEVTNEIELLAIPATALLGLYTGAGILSFFAKALCKVELEFKFCLNLVVTLSIAMLSLALISLVLTPLIIVPPLIMGCGIICLLIIGFNTLTRELKSSIMLTSLIITLSILVQSLVIQLVGLTTTGIYTVFHTLKSML